MAIKKLTFGNNTTILQRSVGTMSYTTEPQAILHRTLDNPNAYSTSNGDAFGYELESDGIHVIVGAIFEDDANGTSSGKAYIFDVATGSLLHQLDNPNTFSTGNSDQFGGAVDIAGNYAIVGVPREGDASGPEAGKAYIYNVTTGALLRTLNNPSIYSTAANDSFGYSVAINGNLAIVGAYREDATGSPSTGNTYIFNISTGALIRTLYNPNEYSTRANDGFGDYISTDGDYVAISARNEDSAQGDTAGVVYIFNVTTGSLVSTILNPNANVTDPNDRFGYRTDISGNNVIVGAYWEDDAGGTNSGKAYIFDATTGALIHTLDNPNPGNSQWFGFSVGISSKYAMATEMSGEDGGKAYIFDVTTGDLIHTLDNPNAYGAPTGDQIGRASAIFDDYAILAANYEDDAGGNNSGKVYIFELS